MFYMYTDLRTEHSRRGIDRLVDHGSVIRAGRFFATPGTDEAAVAALQHGARATCLTAAKHHGLWVPEGSARHVYTRRGLPVPKGWITHGRTERWPEPDPVASPRLLLEHATRCLDPVALGILTDSALHKELVHEADIAMIRRRAPRSVHRVLDRTTSLAESGTETKVRLYLQLKRVPVRTQVQIPGVGRVDLLVGNRWIIECDSKEHHTGRSAYEYDRERDGASLDLGYFTSRLTYEMVFGCWTQTTERLDRVLASRQHLITPEQWIRTRRRR